MPYKISGTTNDSTKIFVINDSNVVEAYMNTSPGAFEIEVGTSGNKIIVGVNADGQGVAYGSVLAYNGPGTKGVFTGGSTGSNSNVMDYINISILGNAADFGDLLIAKNYVVDTSNGANDRGIIAGGNNTNDIEYINISNNGNATNFGDLTQTRYPSGATSNNTNNRGIVTGDMWFGGATIDYFAINTTGNASVFGNLTVDRVPSATSNGTNDRGVFMGGCLTSYVQTNIIDYVTISTTGNASDFGDITVKRWMSSATSNLTNNRGVNIGGYDNEGDTINYNTIDYITINSLGNAQDFGDMVTASNIIGTATSNGTNNRGVIGCVGSTYSNTISYITITTPGNAPDFGDLTVSRTHAAAMSNS